MRHLEASTPSALWFAQTSESFVPTANEVLDRHDDSHHHPEQNHHHGVMWFGCVEEDRVQHSQRSGNAHFHQAEMLRRTHEEQRCDRHAAAKAHKKQFPSEHSLATLCANTEGFGRSEQMHTTPKKAVKPLQAPYGTTPGPANWARHGADKVGFTPHRETAGAGAAFTPLQSESSLGWGAGGSVGRKEVQNAPSQDRARQVCRG